ncbi:MAG TPA: DUF692 family protein [Anaerolineaceae bacterium]|nr:DUF692 family protein [Anaerolineaceae bacterium]
MRFAVNYSVPLENLIKAGSLSVDLIKCPEWLNIIGNAQKLGDTYTHNEIALGNNRLKNLDFEKIKFCLELTKTPHLNCHLWGSIPFFTNSPQELSKQLDIWMRDIEMLRSNLPGYEIICENLPAESQMPAWDISRFPDLLAEFMLKSDAGLLLDLSHARITAMNYGLEYQAYIAALPTDRLEELHVTGIKPYNSTPHDHFEMQDSDWEPTTWAAEQIRSHVWKEPRIVAFEYGGVGDIFGWRTNSDHLLDQVPRLQKIFQELPRKRPVF